MSEEEKKLFEAIKYKNKHLFLVKVDADFLINLIEEQQKELNSLKEIEQLHKEENGKLRVELKQEKTKTPETIRKQFEVYQNKIQALEKQHEYDMQMIDEVKGNAVKCANELEQEKEKNKDLQKQLNGAFDRGFISKDKLKSFFQDQIIYRQFELQQEYKDFKDDIKLNTLQDIKEEILED